ncbi:MAG: four helix bundle suffix domain-containing protein [Prevotella sp.]|nr:four helix bundle suffix domain-containing protein [Prevotella sp.]
MNGKGNSNDNSNSERLIRPVGDYRQLRSYQKAAVIFEMTFFFCHRFLEKGDRTIDQMVQAARSGKQNIVEGCSASSTSSKTEIKLLNVAKASLQELLEDYIDFLHTRGHRRWEEGSVEYNAMRELGKKHNDPAYFLALCECRPPETIANMAIILIYQADYLLFRQLQSLENAFIKEGGFSKRMMRMRKEKRGY